MEKKKWIDLEYKNVIVTGGSSGIGEQIVNDLIDCSARVAIIDVNEPKNYIEKDNFLFVKADIRDKEDIENAINKITSKFGKIDALINNAGVTRPRILVDYYKKEPKYEMDIDDFYFMVDINMKGTLLVTQSVVKRMLEQNSGVIINMSSAAGINGSKGHSIYAATKSAINSFTLSWSKELANFGIRVVGIAPDVLERTPANNDEKYRAQAYGRGMDVDTPPEEFFKNYKSSIPLGRPGYLYEVSSVVNFLVSDHASYLTGIIIPVAGGKTRN